MEQLQDPEPRIPSQRAVDEIDRGRSQEYALLAALLSRSPDASLIARLSLLEGDTSPLGAAHADLAAAAARADAASVAQEYFDLFGGLGQKPLLPYASQYLTGSLYGRPLARLRESLQRLGIESSAGHSEPEDHVAILCEVMAGLVSGEIAASAGADREFFDNHMARWIRRFFVDLERAPATDFYSRVGALGRTFVDVETEAFALPT